MYASGPRDLQTEGIEAESFEALAEIAQRQVRLQGPSGMVCGPISTGGTNNQLHNFEIFNATVHGLLRQGKTIFNQIPYEYGLRRLILKWEAEGNSGYCIPILEIFYARIFESELITHGYFIPPEHVEKVLQLWVK